MAGHLAWLAVLFLSTFKKGIILLEQTAWALSRLYNLHSKWRVNSVQNDRFCLDIAQYTWIRVNKHDVT